MPRFADKDTKRIREVVAELGCLREGAASALAWLPATLVDLLQTDKGLSCTYAPRGASLAEPETLVNIDNDKAVAWLLNGAQPTERVAVLLKKSGAWEQFESSKAAK